MIEKLRKKFMLFGFFWYSPKQDKMMKSHLSRRNYARQLVTGKVVYYSMWTSKPWHCAKWDDIKLVAIGFYDHGEES